MKACRSHPEAPASLWPVPGAAAASRAASTEATVPLGEGMGRLRPREVQADCQDRPVGGQDGPSWRRAGHEQCRVSPGERKPVHHAVSEVVGVGAHEVPPRSGLPNRDHHRGCPHLLPKRSPHFPNQGKRAVNPAIFARPLLSEGIDARGSSAPMKCEEPGAMVVCARREEVHGMWAPSSVQEAEEPLEQHRILRDEHL